LLSLRGIQDRIFTLAFSGLVYAQIWEDPEIDMEAMALGPDDRVVAIASGGCNVMSYLIANPAAITAVDLNAHHIALNRLKVAALRHGAQFACRGAALFRRAALRPRCVEHDADDCPAQDRSRGSRRAHRNGSRRRHEL
jgi:S-adenosylmethionine:diacylglycerol 3-amino-3-carboxypropyl transferase